jgi:hypothetical protein
LHWEAKLFKLEKYRVQDEASNKTNVKTNAINAHSRDEQAMIQVTLMKPLRDAKNHISPPSMNPVLVQHPQKCPTGQFFP